MPVEAGRVYVLSGQVSFDVVAPPGACRLGAIFRDASGQVVAEVNGFLAGPGRVRFPLVTESSTHQDMHRQVV